MPDRGENESFACTFGEGPIPEPGGTRMTFTATEQDALLDGAVSARVIRAADRPYYAARIEQGGRDGADVIYMFVASAATTGDEVLASLWPGPAAAAEEPHHGPVAGHGPMRVQHAHEHADYQGGTHHHVHMHDADASHQPGTNHMHVEAPTERVPRPRVAASADEVYDALWPTPQRAAEEAEQMAARQDRRAASLRRKTDFDNTLRASSPLTDGELYDYLFPGGES